jgi:hypothetical protein
MAACLAGAEGARLAAARAEEIDRLLGGRDHDLYRQRELHGCQFDSRFAGDP